MAEEVTLPVSEKNCRVWRYIAILGPVAALGIFFAPLLLSGVGVDEVLGLLGEGLTWAFILPALLPLLLGYIALVNQSERLVFGDSHLERRGLPHPSIRRGPVPYSEIHQVRAGGFGLLIVEVADEKTLRIYPDGYEGGTKRVLSLIRSHISADRLQENLEAALKTKTRKDRMAPFISIAAMSLVVLGGWSHELIDLARKRHAWSLEFEPQSRDQAIEDFALGSDGVVWLYVRGDGGFADPANYSVRRVDSAGEQTWRLPGEEQLLSAGAPGPMAPYAARLGLNDSGEPVLTIDPDLPTLRLSAGQWVWETGDGAASPDPFSDLAAMTGDPYWTNLRSRPVILARQAGGSPPGELALGTEGQGFLLDFRVDYLSSLIARITVSNGRVFLSILSDPQDSHAWIEVDMSGATLLEPWELVDYSTDSTGALVVLVRDATYCDSDEAASHLGSLDSVADSWRWRTVFQPGPCDTIFGEPRFIIDGHNRIWLPASREVSVFPPETLFGGEVEGIIRYTPYNSGLAGGARLQIDSDGRLWAMDPFGEGVAWINPRESELPRPLPAWIAAWREDFWWQMAPLIAGMVLLVGGFAWIRRDAPKSRS